MSTVNRVTGLATGMDTESIVKQLMDAERTPLVELQKEKTKIEWQREALLDVNSKLLSFRNEALDMKLEGTYKSYLAKSSNSSILSANTTIDAQEGIYKVKVRKLATQTTLVGDTLSQEIYSNTYLNLTTTDFSGKEFNVTYNGTTKTIKFNDGEGNFATTADFREAVQAKLDEAFGADQIQFSVTGEADNAETYFTSGTSLKIPITLSSGGSSNDALEIMGYTDGMSTSFDLNRTLGGDEGFLSDDSFTDDKINLTVNGKTFTFSKGDTLNTVFKTINNDTEADATIRFSNTKESIIVNRDSYGAGRDLQLGGCEEFWDNLGIYTSDDDFMATSKTLGENAIFDITSPDGEYAEEVTSSSNNFTYAGVSMTFIDANEDETVSIEVTKNVDEIYDKIKGFVDSYNELLGSLNKYYKQEKSGYDPLTDEERESLSETQEEQWEERAKEGILKRDSTLQSAINSMRSAVTSYVSNSSISSLFQIGISTVTYDPTNTENNGKLEIDEDKLKQAIKDDIDGVANLFASTSNMIQGNKLESTDLQVEGKDFKITYGNNTKTITFDKNFDLSTSEGKNEFEDYLKEQFEKNFGTGCISVTYTGGKILINSVKNIDVKLTAGTNDALADMGIKDGAKYDTAERGFATKLYDICTTTMNGIIDKAGSTSNIVDNSTLGQALKRKKEAMATLEDRLAKLEERYYDQFAAMEDAISRMNSQSESLVNMLNN